MLHGSKNAGESAVESVGDNLPLEPEASEYCDNDIEDVPIIKQEIV